MFNYKAAIKLVDFIGTIKILAMVLTILWTVVAAVGAVVVYGINAQNDIPVIFLLGIFGGAFGVIVSLVVGAFWTAVVWAVFGFFQHHLSAVNFTAFHAGERAKLGI